MLLRLMYVPSYNLPILIERKDCFDLVLSDVHMPGMDGYKLLQRVGLEMDLPVISNTLFLLRKYTMNKELRNSQALEDSGSVEAVSLVSERSEGRLMKRVVWSNALHQQFVNAVNRLGIDKAKPKRILELMNVPGLSRDNVASHLQKFRMCQKGQTQMLMKNLESWKDLQVSDIDQHRRAEEEEASYLF